MASQISQNENEAISMVKKLPVHILDAFRKHSFDADFIQKHPSIFLTWDWININALRDFLHKNGHSEFLGVSLDPGEVKVKQEIIDVDDILLANQSAISHVYTTCEDGHDVTYILDSDEEVDIKDCAGGDTKEMEMKAPSSSQDGSFDLDPDYVDYQEEVNSIDNISRCSSPTAIDCHSETNFSGDEGSICSVDEDDIEVQSDAEIASVTSDEAENSDWEESGTVWLDDGISSE
ncbi:hypothetical protein F5880DRAFT_1601470, partial [Lentinula raphanica]